MRTQITPHAVARVTKAPRPARTDAAVIAQFIQDLTRKDGAETVAELSPA